MTTYKQLDKQTIFAIGYAYMEWFRENAKWMICTIYYS